MFFSYFVCDGRRINMKIQNAERARLRKTAHEQLSTAATDMGSTDTTDTDRLQAVAVGSLGPAAALVLISVCNELGVSCEIALFESEHQLAALQRQGKINIILANDSDFIRLGCFDFFFPGISTITKKFNHLWFHDCRYWPGTSALDTYAAPILYLPPSAKNDISALLLTHDLKENSFVKLLCVITLVMGFNMIPLIAVLLGNDYVDHKRCFPNIGTSKAIDIVYMCCMKNYPTVDFTCVLQATTVEEMKLLLPVSSFVNIPVKANEFIFW